MPVERGYTTRDGNRVGYYQWGSNTKFFYEPGDEESREEARRKAEEQRAAAYASGYDN